MCIAEFSLFSSALFENVNTMAKYHLILPDIPYYLYGHCRIFIIFFIFIWNFEYNGKISDYFTRFTRSFVCAFQNVHYFLQFYLKCWIQWQNTKLFYSHCFISGHFRIFIDLIFAEYDVQIILYMIINKCTSYSIV